MKFSKNLKFTTIHRNLPITSEITDAVKKAYTMNKKLFKKTPKKFKIIICDNQKELKKQAKYYYQPWMTATVLRNNDLITRSPEFIEKTKKWKRKDFPSIMDHELTHLFWDNFYTPNKPCWLSEGLPCYVGKNFLLTKKQLKKIIKEYKINHSLLDYRYLKKKFDKGHIPKYPVWAGFTRYIIKKHSIKKLMELIEQYSKNPAKNNYNKLFKKYFKKSDRQLFNEFKKQQTF